MSVSNATRRLIVELTELLDKKVIVITASGRSYEGLLKGFDHPSLNIVLVNALDDKGKKYPKVVISGTQVSEILGVEVPLFDPKEFARIVEPYFPKLVRVHEDIGAVIIAERIKVTENGVEGSGPLAEKVRSLFEEYMERKRKERGLE